MKYTSLSKVKMGIQNWGWQQGNKIRTKLHDLDYFFWETTLRCNLNCRHCGSDCSSTQMSLDLSAAKVVSVFQNIADNYDASKIMVAVTGGEPLVRQDLFDILEKVNQLGFPWGMVTNGMLVNEHVVKKCIATGMRTVSVSVDGMEDTHNWLRNNKLSYKNAINALNLFIKSESFSAVEAITCVNSKNIDELESMYEIFRIMGVKKWRVFSIFPKGRAENESELVIDKDKLIKIFEFISDKRRSMGTIDVSYSEEGYLGCDWERKVRDDFFFCGAGINIGGLLHDGSYSACPSLSREWIQGHVDEISFSEAWENKYKNMRDRNWMKREDCSSCKQWNNCQGSSLHLWDWENQRTKVCHYKLLNIE